MLFQLVIKIMVILQCPIIQAPWAFDYFEADGAKLILMYLGLTYLKILNYLQVHL